MDIELLMSQRRERLLNIALPFCGKNCGQQRQIRTYQPRNAVELVRLYRYRLSMMSIHHGIDLHVTDTHFFCCSLRIE